MYEFLTTVFQLVGFFLILYVGGWVIELGRSAARRTLKVCDNCFEMVKRMKGE